MLFIAFFGLVFIFVSSNVVTSSQIQTTTAGLEEKLNKGEASRVIPTSPVKNKSLTKDYATSTIPYEHVAKLKLGEFSYNLNFNSGESLFISMQHLKDAGDITFESKNYPGMGQFIYSINGVKSDGSNYWIFYVNGKEAQIGVSNYKLNEDDQIEWRYEKSKY